jgi:hypothetical protein
MNVKGVVISSGQQYKIFDCEVSLPSLKIHSLEDQGIKDGMGKAEYTSVLFTLEGESMEVGVYAREDGGLYANARQLSEMNLTKFNIIKQNTLVKKYLNNKNEIHPQGKNLTNSNNLHNKSSIVPNEKGNKNTKPNNGKQNENLKTNDQINDKNEKVMPKAKKPQENKMVKDVVVPKAPQKNHGNKKIKKN